MTSAASPAETVVPSSVSPLSVAFAADDAFSMPLAAAAVSVLDNFPRNSPINIFVLDGGFSPSNLAKIKESIVARNCCLQIVKVSKDSLGRHAGEIPLRSPYSLATYYRFLLPQLLPRSVEKVIYLDSDLVVNGNVEELWSRPLAGNAVAAVTDVGSATIAEARHLADSRGYQSRKTSAYFNAGVLVIDLSYWREHDVAQKVMEVVSQERNHLLFLDQDALNLFFAFHWSRIEPQWNQMHLMHHLQSPSKSPYSVEELVAAVNHPKIIHYTLSPKPWMKGCTHPQKDVFFKYVDKTAWRGWRPHLIGRGKRRVEMLSHRWLSSWSSGSIRSRGHSAQSLDGAIHATPSGRTPPSAIEPRSKSNEPGALRPSD